MIRKETYTWEGLLEDLYRRGLTGEHLRLIVTDGCPGLAAAIQTVYPRVLHQRCWVHKMRNILERVRRRPRPMVCFVNELSVERIIYAIFHRFNEQWKNRTLRLFTQAA